MTYAHLSKSIYTQATMVKTQKHKIAGCKEMKNMLKYDKNC